MTEPIKKSEAAVRWGIDRSMVTLYLRRGMPVLPDGRLDWPVVDQWRQDNVLSERSGSYRARERKQPVVKREEKPPVVAVELTAADLVQRLHDTGMERLGVVADALKLSPAVKHAVFSVVMLWLWEVCGEEVMSTFGPLGPAVNYAPLAASPLSESEEQEIEAWIATAAAALEAQR